ncbi:hypothetical protein P9112_006947 [Eukaryota sp. TZLM1-RC]
MKGNCKWTEDIMKPPSADEENVTSSHTQLWDITPPSNVPVVPINLPVPPDKDFDCFAHLSSPKKSEGKNEEPMKGPKILIV